MRALITVAIIVFLAALLYVVYSPVPEPVATRSESVNEQPVAVDEPEQIDPTGSAEKVAAPGPAVTPDEQAAAPEVPEIQIEPGANFLETMSSLGIKNIEERLASWYKSRGYAFSDQTGTYLLEQPYEEYDDETLRAFAENGDIWAQQFLAERLARSLPAEALELYQQAAASGSINAMQQMVQLYNRLDLMRADAPHLEDTHRQQLYAIKDSGNSAKEMAYAWAVAAELAGGDPFMGNQRVGSMSDRLDAEGRERACEMAESLYDQMVNERTTRNLGDFDRQPPPFMLGNLESLSTPTCTNLRGRTGLDYSGCKDVNAVISGQSNPLVICNPDVE